MSVAQEEIVDGGAWRRALAQAHERTIDARARKAVGRISDVSEVLIIIGDIRDEFMNEYARAQGPNVFGEGQPVLDVDSLLTRASESNSVPVVVGAAYRSLVADAFGEAAPWVVPHLMTAPEAGHYWVIVIGSGGATLLQRRYLGAPCEGSLEAMSN